MTNSRRQTTDWLVQYWLSRLQNLSEVYAKGFIEANARMAEQDPEAYFRALSSEVIRLEKIPRETAPSEVTNQEVRKEDSGEDQTGGNGMKKLLFWMFLAALPFGASWLAGKYGTVVYIALGILLLAGALVALWLRPWIMGLSLANKGRQVLTGAVAASNGATPQGRKAPLWPWLTAFVGVGAVLVILLGPQYGVPEYLISVKEGWGLTKTESSPQPEAERATEAGKEAATALSTPTKAAASSTSSPTKLATQLREIYMALKGATKVEDAEESPDPFPDLSEAKLEGGQKFSEVVKQDLQDLASSLKDKTEAAAASLAVSWWEALASYNIEQARSLAAQMEELLPILSQKDSEGERSSSPLALVAAYQDRQRPEATEVADSGSADGGGSGSADQESGSGGSGDGSNVPYNKTPAPAPKLEPVSTQTPPEEKFVWNGQEVSRTEAYSKGLAYLMGSGLGAVESDKVVSEYLDTLAKIASSGVKLDLNGNLQNYVGNLAPPASATPIPTPAPKATISPPLILKKGSTSTPIPRYYTPTPRWVSPTAVLPPTVAYQPTPTPPPPSPTPIPPTPPPPSPTPFLPMIVKTPVPTPVATRTPLPLIMK